MLICVEPGFSGLRILNPVRKIKTKLPISLKTESIQDISIEGKNLSTKEIKNDDYRAFIQDVKERIQSAQIKAAVAVNRELLYLYWDLAERIAVKQQEAVWGDGFLAQMSRDLQTEFPKMKGFSKRNLELMRQWYRFWSNESSIAKQLVSQIPWGHNLVIISKIKNSNEALFYLQVCSVSNDHEKLKIKSLF
ncbi:MAG: DUF1016 N-terminal domain-containing protein [Deltaproteobacteria bacterium]|nr:DUF1016 N-terminal domain-containing protein [Deltaproteobacteria bacterium]